jgi:outer membrane receptor protein involved in Fe transport
LSEAETQYLDVIIVTATRRETPLSEVPASVHVKTAEQMQLLNAFDFVDYGRNVTGLSFTDTGFGGATPVIRGVQTQAVSEPTPTTAIYLGEVPITAAPDPLTIHYPPDIGLVDIERIEVLRGPQGTLYGSSALGGAMRIFPAEPDARGVDAFWEAGMESVTDGDIGYRLSGMFNTPAFGDQGAIRGVAYVREVGGYIDNLHDGNDDVNNRTTKGARISGLYHIGEQWSITGTVMHQSTEWDGNPIENVPAQPRTQDQLPSPGSDDLSVFELRVDGEFGWGTVRSVTSWYEREWDTRGDLRAFIDLILSLTTTLDPVPENFTTVFNQNDSTQFVQEVRFVSNDSGRFKWVAGVFYQDVELHPNQDFPSPGFDSATGGLAAAAGVPDNLTIFRGTYEMDQFALYGEGTYALNDRLELTLGLRHSWIERRERSTGIGWLFPTDPVDDSADESVTTPGVSLGFRPNETLQMYVRAAEGFRPGGTNPQAFFANDVCQNELAGLGLNGVPTSYAADGLWSYEAGLNTTSNDGRYRFSGAVYHLDWSDIQSAVFLPDCGNVFFENAGEATVDGTELELTARPTDDLYLSAGIAYLRAELAEDAPNFGASKGDRIPGVPELTANLTAQWYFRRFGNWESYVQASYNYIGNSFTQFNPAFADEIPSYSMTRLAVGLESDAWSINLFANNLFDERGITNIVADLRDPWLMTSRPRAVGLVVRWRM